MSGTGGPLIPVSVRVAGGLRRVTPIPATPSIHYEGAPGPSSAAAEKPGSGMQPRPAALSA
jgi:hypothetical protein